MNRLFALSALTLALASAAFPQESLVPASAIPDDIAYTAMFYVVRTAPAPHWDRETCTRWLEARGFLGDEINVIIEHATRFYAELQVAETKLDKVNKENAGNLHAPNVEAQRQVIHVQISGHIAAAVSDIRRMLLPASKATRRPCGGIEL
jgi:hypothetical protein